MINHIRDFLPLNRNTTSNDKPWWMLSQSDDFTVKTAWEEVRNRKYKPWFFTEVWKKGFLFKISFCLGGFGENITIDDIVARCGIPMISRYRCSVNPQLEAIEHLFLTGQFSSNIWTRFALAAGIQGPFVQIKQTIVKC